MTQEWIDPAIFSLGMLEIRWYGFLVVISFFVGAGILLVLTEKGLLPLDKFLTDKLFMLLIPGLFIGGRLFYVFFYNWEYYSANFVEIFMIWRGGFAFHGSLMGAALAVWIFSKRYGVNFFQLSDSLCLASTPGLFLLRVGNFINGELYGRVTDSWIGIVFPEGGPFPRHPSQIYEGILEGVILLLILGYVYRHQKMSGITTSFFLFLYGLLRIIGEFYREPDVQLGYYFGYFTIGQFLCMAMMILAAFLFRHVLKLKIKNPAYPIYRS